jgi:hypothetical protein
MVAMDTTRSANALGDPRALGISVQDDKNLRAWLKGKADYQRELRATIPAGGRRAMYLDHLHALAEATGAILTLYHPRGFIAQWAGEIKRVPGFPLQITTPLPLTRGHYLTGLHEFGHAHHPDLPGNGSVTARGVYGELMAHVWAFEHSRVSVTRDDIDQAQAKLCLDAKEVGWEGGPLADWMPGKLRDPFSDGLARLEAAVLEGGEQR